ncbi:MAG: thioredoxin family protein [Tepidisphaeraceae bacterium]
MTADYLRSKFEAALDYNAYVATGTDEQRRRWGDVAAKLSLTGEQKTLLGGFTRRMPVLVISGIWCGDCVAQGPMIDLIGKANPNVLDVRFVDRDVHKDLADQVKLNAGHRVPTALFLAEDFELCSLLGDRTLSRYRAIAARQLGASCPVGIVPPGDDELAATVQDWVNEFERVQLMLRVSPRLRQIHQD